MRADPVADFRAYMQEMLDGVMEGKHRDSYSGVAVKKHDEREAQRLFSSGLVKLKRNDADLPSRKGGSPEWHLLKGFYHDFTQ